MSKPEPYYTEFAVRRYEQDDGVLRVIQPSDLPDGCPALPRMFTIDKVPPGRFRGDHAHKKCHQVFVMLRGSCWISVEMPDGKKAQKQLSADRHTAIWVPPMRWCTLTSFYDDPLLLVLASHDWDAGDYIHTREEFTA